MKWSFFLLVMCISCKGYDSYEYLNGDFIGSSGQNAATLISPANNAATTASEQFTWTKQDGAKSYRVEFASTNSFASPILSATVTTSSYTINTANLIGTATLPQATYYWRVTTNYASKSEISVVFKFNLLDTDVIYVDINSSAQFQYGNQASPFRAIQIAMNYAASNAKNKVYVAKGDYYEVLTLIQGVSLYGGYDATNWSRNISANTTRIRNIVSSYNVFGFSGITSTTVFDGFTLENTSGVTPSAIIYLTSSSPTISNNTISLSTGNGFDYGIRSESSSAPTILNNSIMGVSSGSVTTNYCIYNANSSPTIIGNNLHGGSGVNANYGIYNSSASPTISNNTITGGNGGTSDYGIYNSSSSPMISNNIITGGNSGNNYGIYNISSSSPTISNNTINGGGAGLVTGILLDSGSTPTINNNIVFTTAGAPRYCIWEGLATADPASFQNNNLFDCPSALYRDENTTNMVNPCGPAGTGNTDSFHAGIVGTCVSPINNGASPVNGNISIANTTNQLFVDIDGADNNIATMSDNDWHLTTNAAICNVRGGGLTISGVTLDKDGVTRTTGNPLGGCVPANTGATGWSMGAYESN